MWAVGWASIGVSYDERVGYLMILSQESPRACLGRHTYLVI